MQNNKKESKKDGKFWKHFYRQRYGDRKKIMNPSINKYGGTETTDINVLTKTPVSQIKTQTQTKTQNNNDLIQTQTDNNNNSNSGNNNNNNPMQSPYITSMIPPTSQKTDKLNLNNQNLNNQNSPNIIHSLQFKNNDKSQFKLQNNDSSINNNDKNQNKTQENINTMHIPKRATVLSVIDDPNLNLKNKNKNSNDSNHSSDQNLQKFIENSEKIPSNNNNSNSPKNTAIYHSGVGMESYQAGTDDENDENFNQTKKFKNNTNKNQKKMKHKQQKHNNNNEIIVPNFIKKHSPNLKENAKSPPVTNVNRSPKPNVIYKHKKHKSKKNESFGDNYSLRRGYESQ